MELLKKLLLRPTELISQVSTALQSPSTPRIVLKSHTDTGTVVAGNEIKGILFVKCPPKQLTTVQVTLKGSAKTQGLVNRIQSAPNPHTSAIRATSFDTSYTRTQHLATNYHSIVNDTRTLYQAPTLRSFSHHQRPLITPQSRLPRTLGPGRRPKPVVSCPTYRFPFAIQVPQSAPSTHDDSANTAPSSIQYSLTARILSPLPKLPSSHSLPITVLESALLGGGDAPPTGNPNVQTRTESKSTWSLREPGRVTASVACPDASLFINTSRPQQLALDVAIDNDSPRECTSVLATLSRRDACTVTHEMRTYPAEHVVALADAEIPARIPAYAKGRHVRVVIPDVCTQGWTPSTAGEFDKLRVGYFVTVQVRLSVGTPLEVCLPVFVGVDVEDPKVWEMERRVGRIRLVAAGGGAGEPRHGVGW